MGGKISPNNPGMGKTGKLEERLLLELSTPRFPTRFASDGEYEKSVPHMLGLPATSGPVEILRRIVHAEGKRQSDEHREIMGAGDPDWEHAYGRKPLPRPLEVTEDPSEKATGLRGRVEAWEIACKFIEAVADSERFFMQSIHPRNQPVLKAGFDGARSLLCDCLNPENAKVITPAFLAAVTEFGKKNAWKNSTYSACFGLLNSLIAENETESEPVKGFVKEFKPVFARLFHDGWLADRGIEKKSDYRFKNIAWMAEVNPECDAMKHFRKAGMPESGVFTVLPRDEYARVQVRKLWVADYRNPKAFVLALTEKNANALVDLLVDGKLAGAIAANAWTHEVFADYVKALARLESETPRFMYLTSDAGIQQFTVSKNLKKG